MLALGEDQGYISEQDDEIMGERQAAFQELPRAAVDSNVFVDFNTKMKGDAVKWCKGDPRSILIIMTTIGAVMEPMLRHNLYVSGAAWAQQNDANTLAGHPRNYRILEASTNFKEKRAALAALQLLCDAGRWVMLPLCQQTLRNRGLAFRILSKFTSGTFIMLYLPHKGCPYCFFKLLNRSSEDDEEIKRIRPCMRCDYTEDHIQTWSGDELFEEESRQSQGCVAEGARCETTIVETGHGYWQAEAKAKSLHVSAVQFPDLSAIATTHKQRILESRWKRKLAPPKPPGRKPTKQMLAKTTKRKRRMVGQVRAKRGGYGGPWRTYVSDQTKGKKGRWGIPSSRLSAEYSQLKGTPAFADLLRRGRAHCDARASTAAGSSYKGTLAPDCASAQPPLALAPPAPLAEVASTAIVPHAPSVGGALVAVDGNRAAQEARQSMSSTLALAIHKPLPVALSMVQSAGRHIARACATRAAAQEQGIHDWSERQTASVRLPARPPAIDGFHVVPSHPGVVQCEWVTPAIAFAQRALKAAKEPQHTPQQDPEGTHGQVPKDLHHTLRVAWKDRSLTTRHINQPKLGTVKPSRLAASLCRCLGICICKAENQALKIFRLAFIASIKPLYKKEAHNANKNKARFEQLRGFLKLEWYSIGMEMAHDPPTFVTWYHLPWTNQSSWAVALTRLYPDDDLENVRDAIAVGHIALRAAPGGSNTEVALEQPFDAWGIENCPRSFLEFDLSSRCQFFIYEMFESDRLVPHFTPGALEVVSCNLDPVVFWPGSAAALDIAARRVQPLRDAPLGPAGANPDAGPVALAPPPLQIDPPVDVVLTDLLPLVDGDPDAAEDVPPWLDRIMQAAVRAAEDHGDDEVEVLHITNPSIET